MSKSRDQNLPDLEYIRELAKVFKRYELDEIEIESGDQRVLLRRGDVASPTAAPLGAAPAAPVTSVLAPPQPPVATAPPTSLSGAPAPSVDAGDYITSPFVGTFYVAPRPDTPAFVTVGSRVDAGTTVCVVEAMKLFNEIEAEFACMIDEVLVENAQAVEFGTKLFRVHRL